MVTWPLPCLAFLIENIFAIVILRVRSRGASAEPASSIGPLVRAYPSMFYASSFLLLPSSFSMRSFSVTILPRVLLHDDASSGLLVAHRMHQRPHRRQRQRHYHWRAWQLISNPTLSELQERKACGLFRFFFATTSTNGAFAFEEKRTVSHYRRLSRHRGLFCQRTASAALPALVAVSSRPVAARL